ncbi:TIGR02444 family protein [Methylocella sp. CPCC 101449]|uniref:TIGR02444 family protein n=1 Tax=Methylocella sp. CPCC 101449 TaxID=2987531 RepID=UPI00288DCC5B|nr:TIGR02444 family protein [Methylocella sp. CPCC 101449]MDT2022464.1 TIGR02444 family protein [Methylocella sp. CPCC 101449]
MTGTPTSSPFWTFSLRFYRLDGVAPACLALQDEQGVDVNVLLFLLFVATQGRSLTQADVAAIDVAMADWRRETVAPLRAVRRVLRTPPAAIDAAQAEALRERIKAVELEAERLEQKALFALRPMAAWGQAGDAAAAAGHVAAYAAHLGVSFPPAPVQVLLDRLASLSTT